MAGARERREIPSLLVEQQASLLEREGGRWADWELVEGSLESHKQSGRAGAFCTPNGIIQVTTGTGVTGTQNKLGLEKTVQVSEPEHGISLYSSIFKYLVLCNDITPTCTVMVGKPTSAAFIDVGACRVSNNISAKLCWKQDNLALGQQL